MNYQLFSAFLLITIVLFLTPGPIVTLIIATGARQARAALLTVAGASTGNFLSCGRAGSIYARMCMQATIHLHLMFMDWHTS